MNARAAAAQRLFKAEPRTLVWAAPVPEGGRAFSKMYWRRGFLGPLRHRFVPYRAEREFRLLEHLHAHGVPCPEPLSWSYRHDRWHGRHEILVTREIPSSVPLQELLRADPAGTPDLAPLFALARRMHDCGIAHGAFYATNILVTLPPGDPPRFHVLDLAHGCRFGQGIVGTRPADYDLLDLLRSIERVVPIDLRIRWIAGYGLHAAGTARILEQLEDHRLERPWRHLRRAETDARELFDRAFRAARR